MNIRDKQVLVVGLGRSGVSSTLFLYQQGARVAATDSKPANRLQNAMQSLRGLPIRLCLGEHPQWLFEQADLIVLSPGVPKAIPPIARAMEQGTPVVAEVELASWYLKDTMIAITGSNGKSTTTALTAHLLRKSGLNAVACGNIGTPLVELIPDTDPQRILVAELSSFQLETIDTFHPHIATVLNVTPDHMDRYRDFDDYRKAKLNIFRNQTAEDYTVIHKDEGNAGIIESASPGRPVYLAGKDTGDHGIFLDDKQLFWRWTGKKQPVLKTSEISIPGPHNLSNAMAASAMALLAGASVERVAAGLRDFQPLEHRLEPVAEMNGVLYINDSKATNVDSASVAIQSFEKPVIAILGGRDKAGDFKALSPLLKAHCRAVVLLGEAASIIDDMIDEQIHRIHADDMEDAVRKAAELAHVGDVVLLSPGCASFDMFDGFEHRGREFKRQVRRLEHG